MRMIKRVAALVLAITTMTSVLFSAEAAEKGMQMLNIPPNPRGEAVGEAMTTLAYDASAIYWNPAALDLRRANEISVNYDTYLGIANYLNMQGRMALPFGSLGAELTWLSYGKLSGLDGVESSAYDLSASLGYGASFIDHFYVGMNVHVLASQLAKDYSGAGVSFDAGLIWANPVGTFMDKDIRGLKPIKLSFVMKNAGVGPAYYEEPVELPLTMKVGLAYTIDFLKDDGRKWGELNFMTDITPLAEDGFDFAYGNEFKIYNIAPSVNLAIRAGYKLPQNMDNPISGLRTGFAVDIFGIEVNYAFTAMGDVGFSHRFGINYKFMKGGIREPGKDYTPYEEMKIDYGMEEASAQELETEEPDEKLENEKNAEEEATEEESAEKSDKPEEEESVKDGETPMSVEEAKDVESEDVQAEENEEDLNEEGDEEIDEEWTW